MSVAGNKRVRTCVGCGKRSDKVELHRIVKTADGAIAFDSSGKVSGRGAYVCSMSCFEAASRGKLQRALKSNFGKDVAARVAEELEKAQISACAR